jgi:hypothetical protein
MGEKIKKIKMSFSEDGFIASPALQKNKEAFDLLRDAFSGKSIDVDVSKVPDEEIKKHLKEDFSDFEDDVEDGKRDSEEDLKTSKKFCIDFDGTCVCEDFPRVGPTVPGAVRVLKKLVDNGHRLIMWTARSNQQLEDAKNWFRDNGIELYAVNKDPHPLEGWPIPRKVIPAWYIDDRNLCTPMVSMSYKGKSYSVVDWEKIEEELVSKGLIR